MSENNYSFDRLIKSDKLPFSADPAIEKRLMYHFQIKAGTSIIKRNSALPFINEIFSARFAGLKIGLATLLIMFAIGFKQFNSPAEINLQADTASVVQNHDTLKLILSGDSVSNN
jgi:hypothetical protein